MFFKLNCSLFLLFFSLKSLAQLTAVGRVADAETGQPIENASVYFNETQVGTKTNVAGRFYITTNSTNAELVVSCVGYYKVILKEIPQQNFKILLKPIDNTLKEVVIGDKNGWEKWGALFTRLLMSDDTHDYYSKQYGLNVVLNPKVIKFYFDREEQVLSASSFEPIWVINDRLGYLIKVDLEEFKYNVEKEYLSYRSTLFFEPTKSNSSLESMQITTNWVYQGSKAHFFKSLINRSLSEEGFGIYRYTEVENLEKLRVKQLINHLKNETLKHKSFAINVNLEDLVGNEDSLKYYKKQLAAANYLSRKLDTLDLYKYLKKDTVNHLFELNFPDTIMVTYIRDGKKLAMHTSYFNKRYDKREAKKVETLMKLTDATPLMISYFGNPISQNWRMDGFMLGKRLASYLPADYEPHVPRTATTNNALKNHEALSEKKR
ncbi:carboxypeptidase-like regulatory domain-containing protein [Pedobacter chitinilyticus]|uniref:Carboxypeptidase-like regulatory domain-containing protein n=1 Tax=Pedobacter chitinilyticus TaxID=2233776 RepID=A0A451GDB4_9SPHI|nr:carboxypeptidase-like regulatory domain-containing protein [Pedobacter chitinilyticus]RWU10850.1 carboxypeptidase-like regulatory domain-containing protein [Pedobacter chitinilyticus]